VPKSNSKVVGGAGEHYVAYVLSSFGYMPALVREGSPAIDLLASNLNGSKTIAIQVKTTKYAKRTRGRGKNKALHHLEFPLGHKAIENAVPELIFCFVDLDTLNPERKPDVYVIPATVFINHYADRDIRQYKWLRLHWSIEDMEKFKNNWEPIHSALGSASEKI
jgi:hypothetical protein